MNISRSITALIAIAIFLALPACGRSDIAPGHADSASFSSSSSSVTNMSLNAASSSNSFPSAPPRLEAVSAWREYADDTFGFRLRYPGHLETPHLIPPLTRRTGAFNNRGDKIEEKPARRTVSAFNAEGDMDFGILMNVFPLDDYSFVNIYDDEFAYRPEAGTWHALRRNELYAPPVVAKNGWKGYAFKFGDAGHILGAIAIPHKTKGVMLEFMFSWCPGCVQNDAYQPEVERHIDRDMKAIIESIRIE